MEIKELDKRDWNKVIQYAIKGMYFDEYLKSDFLLKAYGRYFWYLEYTNATQVITAYEGEELLGVLVADIKNEPKPNKSFFKGIYILVWLTSFKRCFSAVVFYHTMMQTRRCLQITRRNTLPMEKFVFWRQIPIVRQRVLAPFS